MKRAAWLLALVPSLVLAVATVKHDVSGTNSGTITSTVTGTRTVTFQDQTTTLMGRDTTDNPVTNKTFNAEGTGNLFTRIEQQFWQPSLMFNSVNYYNANGSTDMPGTSSPPISNSWPTLRSLDFDPATTEEIAVATQLSSYTSVSDGIDVLLYWGPITGSCSNCGVRWCVKIACATAVTNDFDLGSQQESQQCNVETASTTGRLVQVATFSSITATGCAAGDFVTLSVFRTGANAADQYSGDAALYGVLLRYRTAE